MTASCAIRRSASAGSAASGRGAPVVTSVAATAEVRAVLRQQATERVGQRHRCTAKRGDRAARFGQPVAGQSPGAPHLDQAPSEVATLVQQHFGGFERDRERRQRVGEHVVHLSRDPQALVERRGAGALLAAALLLRQQPLGDVGTIGEFAPGEPRGERSGHDQRRERDGGRRARRVGEQRRGRDRGHAERDAQREALRGGARRDGREQQRCGDAIAIVGGHRQQSSRSCEHDETHQRRPIAPGREHPRQPRGGHRHHQSEVDRVERIRPGARRRMHGKHRRGHQRHRRQPPRQRAVAAHGVCGALGEPRSGHAGERMPLVPVRHPSRGGAVSTQAPPGTDPAPYDTAQRRT